MAILKRTFIVSSIISSLMLIVPALSFAAGHTLKPMTGDEIKTSLTDKTITTIPATTLNGKIVANSFTGYFGRDGKLTGQFAQKPEDGPQKDTGIWKVNADQMLCFKWDNWDSNTERCVSLYRLNNGILVLNIDDGFETVIVERSTQPGNKL